jgi:hypothetical protein
MVKIHFKNTSMQKREYFWKKGQKSWTLVNKKTGAEAGIVDSKKEGAELIINLLNTDSITRAHGEALCNEMGEGNLPAGIDGIILIIASKKQVPSSGYFEAVAPPHPQMN